MDAASSSPKAGSKRPRDMDSTTSPKAGSKRPRDEDGDNAAPAQADAAGISGINGTFTFPGTQLLGPGAASQPWERGMVDSISAPFRTTDGQWQIFYGSGVQPCAP